MGFNLFSLFFKIKVVVVGRFVSRGAYRCGAHCLHEVKVHPVVASFEVPVVRLAALELYLHGVAFRGTQQLQREWHGVWLSGG